MAESKIITAGIIAAVLLAGTLSASAQENKPGQPGVAVDAKGGSVIDPTENVKALSEAANKRQDDLRALSMQLLDTKLSAASEISKIRFEHAQETAAALAKKLNDEANLRADFSEKIALAEAKRIDAIRAVDVNAVAVASQRASDQATVLATQVAQSAEALRTLVATTATTVQTAQQQLANTLSARLTTLEQAGYQQAGQQKIQDPAFVALVGKVDTLLTSRSDLAGISAGRGDVTGWLAAIVSLLLSLAAVVFMARRPTATRR